MFERFERKFRLHESTNSKNMTFEDALKHLSLPSDHSAELYHFLQRFEGASFNNGIYRIYNIDNLVDVSDRMYRRYPRGRGKILIFGSNWKADQYAIDLTQPKVLLLDIDDGKSWELCDNILDFHNEELITDTEYILQESRFESWKTSSGMESITPSQCVGLKVPFRLGGATDDLSNLEFSDMDVFIELCLQLDGL